MTTHSSPDVDDSAVPTMIASTHECGAVLFDVAQGRLFDLNPLGARVWRHLNEDRPLEAIVMDLSVTYGIDAGTVLQDVCEFVAQLRRAGVLDRTATPV